MRAVVVHEYGDVDVLRLVEQPVPQPGPHEVLVEVHATSVNNLDLRMRRSRNPFRTLPITLGFEVSGVIASCGAFTHGWQPGDEVFGCPRVFGNGGNADYVLMDDRAAARKPHSIDHATAASLPLSYLTAWDALHERARIEPGQTLLIHAGASGLGYIAVQLAHLHGCRVITTAGHPESVSFCRNELRAEEVINYEQEDFVARVNELSAGRGVPIVFDTAGTETFKRSIECVAACGQLITVLDANTVANAQLPIAKSITVHYEFIGMRQAYGLKPERQGAIMRSLANLVDTGLLHPHVSLRLPLDELAAAHRHIETGRAIGKVAIIVR